MLLNTDITLFYLPGRGAEIYAAAPKTIVGVRVEGGLSCCNKNQETLFGVWAQGVEMVHAASKTLF